MTSPQQMPPAGGPGVTINTPEDYWRDLLARYFRPGMADSIIRTWVPILLGSVWSWVAFHFAWLGLPDHPSMTFTLSTTGAVIAGYYLLARLVEHRWPRIGRIMVALNLTSTKPVYVTPPAAPAVEQAAAAEPADVTRARMRLRGHP